MSIFYDLATGFHQIEMQSQKPLLMSKTVTTNMFECPATFQRVVNNILKELQNKICLYMDDIIIFSISLQEYINNLKQVFQKLQEARLQIQLDRSEFLCKSVEFLGHVITPFNVTTAPLILQ